MKDNNLSDNAQLVRWLNRYFWASFIGFALWVIAFTGHLSHFTHDLAYQVLVIAPVLLLITPIQLLLCGLIAYRWDEWPDHRKRGLTLAFALCVLASLPVMLYLRLF